MSCRHIFQNIFPRTYNSGRNVLFLVKRCCIYQRHYSHGGCLSVFSVDLTTKRTFNSQQNTVPWTVLSRRQYNNHGKPVNLAWKHRLWRIMRGIFLATGGIVWALMLIAYVSLEKVDVDVQSNGNLNSIEQKLMDHFYKEKNEAGILKKDEALEKIWNKLSQEDRVKEVFGHPAYICGYNYSGKIEGVLAEVDELANKNPSLKNTESGDDEMLESFGKSEKQNSGITKDKTWEAGCYIEGSKSVGLLKVVFEEHKHEWVPIALHLETLVNSGDIITDVSASLPNGIKNFTRLAN